MLSREVRFFFRNSTFKLSSKKLLDSYFNGALAQIDFVHITYLLPQFSIFCLVDFVWKWVGSVVEFFYQQASEDALLFFEDVFLVASHSIVLSGGPQPLTRFREFFAPEIFWVHATPFQFHEFFLCNAQKFFRQFPKFCCTFSFYQGQHVFCIVYEFNFPRIPVYCRDLLFWWQWV